MRINNSKRLIGALAAVFYFTLPAAVLCAPDKNNPLLQATTLYEGAKYSAAARELQELIDRGGLSSADKEQAYWYLASACIKNGKPDKALSALQLGVQLYPDSLRLNLELARLYYESHLYPQAKRIYEELSEEKEISTSHLPDLNSGLARTYEALGYLARAAERYHKALDQNFDTGLATEYARCLLKQRKYAEAEAITAKTLEQSPDNPELLYLYAKIYYESGRKGQAIDTLKKALSLAGNRDDFRLTLSLWLCSVRRYAEARGQAETVYKANPQQAQAQWALGLALLDTPQDRQRALDLFRSAANSVSSPFTARAAQAMLDYLQNPRTHPAREQ